MYELLVQCHSVPDGETAGPIQKWTEHPKSLECSSFNLVYVTSPGKSFIKDDPQIFDFFNPLNLVSKKPEWLRCRNASSCEEHSYTLADIADSPPVLEPCLQFCQIYLQIFEQKCRLLRCCYQSSIIYILGQFLWQKGVNMSFAYKLTSP